MKFSTELSCRQPGTPCTPSPLIAVRQVGLPPGQVALRQNEGGCEHRSSSITASVACQAVTAMYKCGSSVHLSSAPTCDCLDQQRFATSWWTMQQHTSRPDHTKFSSSSSMLERPAYQLTKE
eukprot:GHUV01031590.1.p1 GENE.GHUV01031590.1~~GHUV01031590.1.p1  ORF type:complete len:122 (-),score=29.43 GHUV01031590.1:71-436(-)